MGGAASITATAATIVTASINSTAEIGCPGSSGPSGHYYQGSVSFVANVGDAP